MNNEKPQDTGRGVQQQKPQEQEPQQQQEPQQKPQEQEPQKQQPQTNLQHAYALDEQLVTTTRKRKSHPHLCVDAYEKRCRHECKRMMSLEAEVVDHIEAAVSEDDSTASATSTVLQHVAQLSGQEMALSSGTLDAAVATDAVLQMYRTHMNTQSTTDPTE